MHGFTQGIKLCSSKLGKKIQVEPSQSTVELGYQLVNINIHSQPLPTNDNCVGDYLQTTSHNSKKILSLVLLRLS